MNTELQNVTKSEPLETWAETITAEQADTLAALLNNRTLTDAAKSLGISRPALYRRLNDPNLMDAWKSARRQMVQRAMSQIQNDADQSANALLEIATDKTANANARVMAASKGLEFAMGGIEADELEQRLAELESLLRGMGALK